jgi:sugar lactone lactonase YvrE
MRVVARWRLAAALGVVLGLAVAAPAPAAVVPLDRFGAEGDDGGALRRPDGVTSDRAGRLYVSDGFNARISVFESDGAFAYAFGWDVIPGNAGHGFEVCTAATTCKTGVGGGGAGQLGVPTGLTIDPSGNLYVGEAARVSVFQAGGTATRFVRAFGWDVIPNNLQDRLETCTTTCQEGTTGGGAGQLRGASGLAFDPAHDELYIGEGNARISVFRGDGTFVRAFGWDVDPNGGTGGFEVCQTDCKSGVDGGAAGQLGIPAGVALDGSGLLYVAEAFNNRISVFDVSGGTGRFLRAFGWDVNPAPGGTGAFEVCSTSCQPGVDGGGPGQLFAPNDVAADSAGRIAISELAGHRISRFGPAGFVDAFGADVTPFGGFTFEVCSLAVTCKTGIQSSGFGGLADAQGVHIDCRGAVWVTDSVNNRVQRFGEPGTPAAPCLPGGGVKPPPPPVNLDADGDGVLRPRDCNDADPRIRPGVRDKPGNRIDQDCDGRDARYPVLARSIDAFSATFPRGRYTTFTTMLVKPVRRGDRLRLTCRGPGCRARTKTVRVRKGARKLSLLRHLKHAKLRSGAVVQLRITHRGTIGRVSTWRIRAPKVPSITRSCLRPGARKPSRCPL